MRIFHTPQERQVEPIGLFIRQGNTGAFRRTSFDVVSEVRINLGFDLADHLRLWTGYSLLTWDGPVRPAEQVLPIHPQVAQRPNFEEEFFLAQGLNVGIELRW